VNTKWLRNLQNERNRWKKSMHSLCPTDTANKYVSKNSASLRENQSLERRFIDRRVHSHQRKISKLVWGALRMHFRFRRSGSETLSFRWLALCEQARTTHHLMRHFLPKKPVSPSILGSQTASVSFNNLQSSFCYWCASFVLVFSEDFVAWRAQLITFGWCMCGEFGCVQSSQQF